ncbi:MAG: histidine--tRNA ligase [Candidatus Hatepunaea meridiana]|nr:histidine--tRNA ligase [Candidatus Hatepunaea meridiana]
MKRPIPKLYRGFRDIFAEDLMMRREMIEAIRAVYERYGFSPLETPAIEYVDILGKFLPESETPEGGIFAFLNENDEWIALRYDLTAPLSRVVAQYKDLQRPFRRYQFGPVWRLEKPGVGRYREFYQFDFDTVGTGSLIADAEACCIGCDALEAVGISRGQYIMKVNSRKVLNGVLEKIGLIEWDARKQIIIDKKLPRCQTTAPDSNASDNTVNCGGLTADKPVSYFDVLRTIDKLDRVGMVGVRELLTKGRKDPSGDYMPGLNLDADAVNTIENYLTCRVESRSQTCDLLAEIVGDSQVGVEGIAELREIDEFLRALGYDEDRVIFDPTVARGLAYYTGPVFEATLIQQSIGRTLLSDNQSTNQTGVSDLPSDYPTGSVFGGGRYDNLVERFTGQKVPATGGSIGVDRLLSALKYLRRGKDRNSIVQVLVTVMDKRRLTEYQLIAQELRTAGINTEIYLGGGGIGRQLKYADKCGIPLVVIAGEDEFVRNEVEIKDLQLGMKLAEEVEERNEWLKDRPAQFAISRDKLVESVSETLAGYSLV